MMWKKIKDEWPPSGSEVVVYYYFHVNDYLEGEPDYGNWHTEVMPEKWISRIDTDKDIYWIHKPE